MQSTKFRYCLRTSLAVTLLAVLSTAAVAGDKVGNGRSVETALGEFNGKHYMLTVSVPGSEKAAGAAMKLAFDKKQAVGGQGQQIEYDPCCPPWNPAALKTMMFYSPSGSIADPYTLKFVPTPAFLNQMQLYINLVHSMYPSTINTITIHFLLYNALSGTGPYTSPVGGNHYITWTAGGPVPPMPNWFSMPAETMQVGQWYAVHTGIFLGPNNPHYFPDKCSNNDIYVRIEVLP